MVQCEMTLGPFEEDILKKLALRDPDYLKRRRRYYIICLVICALSLFTTIFQFATGNQSGAMGYLVYLILFVLVCFVLQPLIARGRLNASYRNMDPRIRYGTRHLTFEEDGVTITSELSCGKRYWNGFRYWGTIDHYLYILLVGNTVILVDQNKLSEEELLELKALVGKYVPTIEQYSHTLKRKGAKL